MLKKYLLFAVTVCLLFGLFILPANADDSSSVQRGTPIVDGLLDEAYLSSATHTVSNTYIYSWGSYKQGDPLPNTGVVYFLWDDNYLYVCGVIEDSTPASQAGHKTWMNDSLEQWFNDTTKNSNTLYFKIHHAADGNFFLGEDRDGQATFNIEDAIHAQTYTDTGYIIEDAFPLDDLHAGKTFKYSGQINDILASDFEDGYAKGSQTPSQTLTLIGDGSEPVDEPSESAAEPSESTVEPSESAAEPSESSEISEQPAEKSANLPLIICIAAAACIIVAVILVLVLKKKK